MTQMGGGAVRLAGCTSLGQLVEAAVAAEQAGAAMVVIDYAPGGAWQIDPVSAGAALAGRTSRIGLCVAPRIAGVQPFTMARALATIGHLSGGRVLWMIDEAANPEIDAEFIEVVGKLWRSWDADALVHDKDNAVFSDVSKVRRIDHDGTHFRVAGPLNMPQPPGGLPIVATAALTADDPRAAHVTHIVAVPAEEARARTLIEQIGALQGRTVQLVIETELKGELA